MWNKNKRHSSIPSLFLNRKNKELVSILIFLSFKIRRRPQSSHALLSPKKRFNTSVTTQHLPSRFGCACSSVHTKNMGRGRLRSWSVCVCARARAKLTPRRAPCNSLSLLLLLSLSYLQPPPLPPSPELPPTPPPRLSFSSLPCLPVFYPRMVACMYICICVYVWVASYQSTI